MKVITIARKPCSESSVAANALKWGTGGLNIDGSRITAAGPSPSIARREVSRRTGVAPITGTKAAVAEGMGKIDRRGSPEVYMAEHPGEHPGENLGRWPANLILCHKGCQQVGEKKVKNVGGASSGESAFGQNSGWNKHNNRTTEIQRLRDADGTETVAAYECEPGCPVAALDAQSGVVATGSWNRQTDGAHPFGNAKDTPYDNWKTVTEAPGGASRYFKQVGLDNTDPSD